MESIIEVVTSIVVLLSTLGLILGMINPEYVIRWGNNNKKRINVIGTYTTAILISASIGGTDITLQPGERRLFTILAFLLLVTIAVLIYMYVENNKSYKAKYLNYVNEVKAKDKDTSAYVESELNKAKLINKDLIIKIRNMRDEKLKLASEVETLNNKLNSKAESVENVKLDLISEVESLNEDLVGLYKERRASNAELNREIEEKDSLKTKLKQVEKENKDLVVRVRDVKSELENAHIKVKDLIVDKESQEANYSKLIEEIANDHKEELDLVKSIYIENAFIENSIEITAEDFFNMKSNLDINSPIKDFTGVYILHNKKLNKYYVGQSVSIIKRVSNHFTGSGNEEVYEDYLLNESVWGIRIVSLLDSGFRSLNELERYFIEVYNANVSGYNKTKGNRN